MKNLILIIAIISIATATVNAQERDYFLNDIVHHFGEHLTTKEFINE